MSSILYPSTRQDTVMAEPPPLPIHTLPPCLFKVQTLPSINTESIHNYKTKYGDRTEWIYLISCMLQLGTTRWSNTTQHHHTSYHGHVRVECRALRVLHQQARTSPAHGEQIEQVVTIAYSNTTTWKHKTTMKDYTHTHTHIPIPLHTHPSTYSWGQ